MKKSFVALLAFSIVMGAALADEHPSEHPKAKARADALDGKVFTGHLVKSGEAGGDKDELTFKGGMFVSDACVKYGFHKAAYTVTEKDGVITFTSNPKNADGETMSWRGTIKQNVLEGTAVYKTKSGETTTYTYKGKMGK